MLRGLLSVFLDYVFIAVAVGAIFNAPEILDDGWVFVDGGRGTGSNAVIEVDLASVKGDSGAGGCAGGANAWVSVIYVGSWLATIW